MLTKTQEKNLKRLEKKDTRWSRVMDSAKKIERNERRYFNKMERGNIKAERALSRAERLEKSKATKPMESKSVKSMGLKSVKSMRLKSVKAMRLAPIKAMKC